ncbi:MAG: hypothetical protein JST85_11875 [Acidobacteria bacterium]|nr:hypothetical protein [Acidobacteriota bacterium]
MSDDLLDGKGHFVEQLAEKLGANATVKTIYGDPIERGDMTIIPVAKILYGFGGGEGDHKGYGGAGGGGGIKVTPIGFIEMKEGEAKFRPIRNSAMTIALAVAGGIAGVLLMRGLRSLFRSTRRDSQQK